MHYRREIDGLRAVAVLPVILFHAGFPAFSGGYVGVDVFFVISGYLITSILLKELAEGRFSILRFYERRARRILPALLVMMAVCVPAAWMLMMPFPFGNFAQSVAAAALSLSNVLFWLKSGYFGVAAEFEPLLHTWSLGVEEQYYVLFPPLLALLWGLGRGRVVWILVALALASLVLSHWMAGRHPQANFFLLPSRAWELLAGSLCAFALRGRGPWRSDAAAGLGLVLILVGVFSFDASTPFPSLWTLLPVGGTALVILCAVPGTAAARLLSMAPLVGIGLISYSAYLWHQPIFVFARIHHGAEPSDAAMLALSAVSLTAGWASWRFVERPFRAAPGGAAPLMAGRRALFSAAALATVAMVAIGIAGDRTRLQTEWWRAHQTAESLQAYELVGLALQAARRETAAQISLAPDSCRFRIDLETAGAEAAFRAVSDHLRTCRDRHGPGLMILGDSHASNLFTALDAARDEPFLVAATIGGCRPHHPGPGCQYAATAAFLAGAPDLVRGVVFEQAGFYLIAGPRGSAGDRKLFLHKPLDRPLPALSPDPGRIDRVAAYLDDIAAHLPVVWFGPRPDPHIPSAALIRAGCAAQFAPRPNQAEIYAALDRAIADRLVGSQVRFVSQIEALRLDLSRDLMSCDVLYWLDGDHFTLDGARRFGPRIAAALAGEPALQTVGLPADR